MYSKFNFIPTNSFYNNELNSHLVSGTNIYDEHEKEVKDSLSCYISEDGDINGNKLKEDWFSISKKDIFISHSHKDINRVKAFAGWLYDVFGLTAFIDSCCWGYCDTLLNKIDKKYCYNRRKNTYNYDLRNYTTSHVHMMLSTALAEMIENTECIIFFNTPNSISMSNELSKIHKKSEKTESPWIYNELLMTTLIGQTKPSRYHELNEQLRFNLIGDSISVHYDVSKYLHDMNTLTCENLVEWKNQYKGNNKNNTINPLDLLYYIITSNKQNI